MERVKAQTFEGVQKVGRREIAGRQVSRQKGSNYSVRKIGSWKVW